MKKILPLKKILPFGLLMLLGSSPIIIAVSINKSNEQNYNSYANMNSKKDKVNVSLLREEAKKTLDNIRKLNAENFSTNSEENNPTKIVDFTKFENDYNSFLDKIEKNPSIDLEQLAKTQFKTKGLDLDKIIKENSKKVKAESSKNTKINSVNFSSYSNFNSMTFKTYADEIWKGHVNSSVFAAINYALAMAYGFAWNFLAAAASGIAAGTLTNLAVEYKKAYNKITADPRYPGVQYEYISHFKDWSKNYIKGVKSSKLGIIGIIKTIDYLRDKLLRAKPILLWASWVSPTIKLVIMGIDIIQSAIWWWVSNRD
ncbi:hypothetical protein [Mesomycoplasma ovipneumoniae]|uniref:Uncharacterized protein n=1 Tax=Mesomycoplasma ovipneumoniae TaxID=29562 RepID=A0AAP6CT13_9BACT|nr:hypothetical protein [Mesomycoplasma ovipneumoniae]MDW2852375.1 hypothetical protein [Mesomycoplasma ovipneumoniae]MDW2861937.1 hypothetical protein [Mesomycoplasma ovipneumoniae]